MEKYGFVYIWYDRKHKRYYVGSHWGTIDDGYICSSAWMMQAYKRRPEDFKRRILSYVYTNRKDLYECETRFLQMIKEDEIKVRYYNLNINGAAHWSANEEIAKSIKEKISEKTKEAMQRSEVREKFLKGLKVRDNRSSDPKVREKRKQTMTQTMAKKFPKENRRKRLDKNDPKLVEIYRQKSKEMWQNRSDLQKEEIGKKISETNKGLKNRLGHTNSEEHRAKISAANKGKIHKRHKIIIDGIVYISTVEASKIIGKSVATINRRIKDIRYPSWKRYGNK